jgi:hypothetical protein
MENVDVLVPAPTEQLFHVCAHAIQLTWVPTVRWIVDAVSVLRAAAGDIDWDRFVGLAHAARMTVRARAALDWLASELDLPIPREAIERLTTSAAAWEQREAALHRKTPPLALRDYARWHWWNFARLRPFDAGWSRMPAPVGFAAYLLAWTRAHPAERLARFRRQRVGAVSRCSPWWPQRSR